MLKKRVITALWGIPLVIIAVWFDEPIPWFTVLAAIVGILAAYEFQKITGVIKNLPLAAFGLVFTVLFIISLHIDWRFNVTPFLLLTIALVILFLILLVFVPRQAKPFAGWTKMVGGALYIGWLLSLLVALRLEPGTIAFPEAGRDFVFLALFATFGSDTLAYFIGKALGKHKMAPRVSPGKTWEGALAGVVGGIVIGLLFTMGTPLQLPLSWWQAILLGAFVSIFGQIGDLTESLLKRKFGVKDSGKMMPGHGGILDRIDSVLFAGVVVYLYYMLVVL